MTEEKKLQLIALAEGYIKHRKEADDHKAVLTPIGDFGYASEGMASTAMLLVELMLGFDDER
jgi:hypothetical protein